MTKIFKLENLILKYILKTVKIIIPISKKEFSFYSIILQLYFTLLSSFYSIYCLLLLEPAPDH